MVMPVIRPGWVCGAVWVVVTVGFFSRMMLVVRAIAVLFQCSLPLIELVIFLKGIVVHVEHLVLLTVHVTVHR